MGIRTQLMDISPAIAERFLLHNRKNRHLRKQVVAKYAADMAAGNWYQTHQGIAIYDDGNIADGQHRLEAIVQSGVTVPMMVTLGLPSEAANGIDQHAARSVLDAMTISNVEWVNRKIVSYARFMLLEMDAGYPRRRAYSVNETKTYCERYLNEFKTISLVLSSPRRGLTPAGVGASLVCALINGEAKTDLERFVNVLLTGIPNDRTESAAIRLRELLLTSTDFAWHSSGNRKITALKIQNALRFFLRGQEIKKLYAPEKFIYPAPKLSTVLDDGLGSPHEPTPNDTWWPLLGSADETHEGPPQ